MKDKPKVVLYYPRPFPSRYTVRAPLPLLAISRFLAGEFRIAIIIHDLYQNPYQKALQECRDAICLGITAFTGPQILYGVEFAKVVRERHPYLPIVWGGWHPTLEPESTIASAYVDIIVRGDGERTFAELVWSLAEGKPLDSILGISYKSDSNIIHNPDRSMEDINNFPSMPYHLIDVEKTLFINDFGNRVIDYVSTSGCPFNCGFCAEMKVHGRRWRALNPYRMADEVEKLVKDYKVDGVCMNDSEFCISKERVRVFCEELIRRNLKIKWGGVNGRIEELLRYEDELWKLLVKSGLKEILVGAESGWQEALDFMNKGLRVEETLELARKCRNYDIKPTFSMFYGLPWDHDYDKTRKLCKKEFELTLQLCQKLTSLSRRNRLYLMFYTPFPGSPLYKRSIEIGLKPPQTLEGWGNWFQELKTTPWITSDLERRRKMIGIYMFLFLDSDSYRWIPSRIGNKFLRSLFKAVFKIFERIVDFRWKYRFFALPFDYWLFLAGRKVFYRAERWKQLDRRL